MKILVIGGGGREHAILKKLAQSKKVDKLYAAPGNGGIAQIAECLPISATDVEGVVKAARTHGIDLVFVAPDDPLMLGMVDRLQAAGIRAFGPRQNAAIIEGSKVFAKNLMKKYGIPTAAYEVFEDYHKALAYVKAQNRYPAVIKAEGLALGKGVIIAQNEEEAEAALHRMMRERAFGDAGNRVVIEEFLTGTEVSVLAFTDGRTVIPMVSAQDHKRVFDNDQGPNTGGMGAFSPSRIYTPEIADYCMQHIYLPTIRAMAAEGRPFCGVLYFGLIVTAKGVFVIEYNARFGDPETQVVLPRLKTDLVEIIEAIERQNLVSVNIEWDDGAAVCVVAASGGYPQSYEKGFEIHGLTEAEELENITVYHAGTALKDGKFITAGGRVLGVTAVSGTLEDAIAKAYGAIEKISFEKMHYRRDIGLKK